jgi:hypothetical protein
VSGSPNIQTGFQHGQAGRGRGRNDLFPKRGDRPPSPCGDTKQRPGHWAFFQFLVGSRIFLHGTGEKDLTARKRRKEGRRHVPAQEPGGSLVGSVLSRRLATALTGRHSAKCKPARPSCRCQDDGFFPSAASASGERTHAPALLDGQAEVANQNIPAICGESTLLSTAR